MILLFGLKGYLGCEVAPQWLVDEQIALWTVEHEPREEHKSDAQRLKEAEQQWPVQR